MADERNTTPLHEDNRFWQIVPRDLFNLAVQRIQATGAHVAIEGGDIRPAARHSREPSLRADAWHFCGGVRFGVIRYPLRSPPLPEPHTYYELHQPAVDLIMARIAEDIARG